MIALAVGCTIDVPIPGVKRKAHVLIRDHRAVPMLTTGAVVIEEGSCVGLPLVAATYRGGLRR